MSMTESWSLLIWTFACDIISSLCEDKAARQPSAALPLIILFAIRDCSYQSREVNAACGVASFPCRHGIISAQGADKAALRLSAFKERWLYYSQSKIAHTTTGRNKCSLVRACFAYGHGIISAQGADKAALQLSAFKERWLYYS